MNRLVRFWKGHLLIRIKGAEPQRCINAFLEHKIAYWDLKREADDCWCCRILTSQLEAAQKGALASMCDLQVLEKSGFRQQFYGLKHRPVLLVMTLLIGVWILLFPNFIWTMHVSGNTSIPDEQILQELEDLGIGVGTVCANLPHPRLLKYEMQLRIPELQWIAVNCYGGRAEVLVEEREPKQRTVSKKEVCNLVAARDGVILEMNILNGFPVVQTGQAVREGQLLVSGFMDHILTTQATRAYGEVFALTKREIQICTPVTIASKLQSGETSHCIYLNIGRNRIKIFGNSGISVSGCDKIVCEKLLTLPGGERLPLGFTVETYQFYHSEAGKQSEAAARQILTQGVSNILESDLIAGQIQKAEHELTQTDLCYMLTTSAWCREMIARAQSVNFQMTKED